MDIIIIGSGMAGLSAAIRLQAAGHQVQVFEANSYPGGKLTEFQLGPYRFDAGPSLFTMPQLIDELYQVAGKNPRDYYGYDQLEVMCHYFWEDGTKLHAYADKKRYAQEVSEVMGVDPQVLERAIADSRTKYELTGDIFLRKPLNRMSTWLSMSVLKALLQLPKLHIFKTMNQVNEQLLQHPKLVQLFNRYATYNGSNPYKAPGILTIIPHLEYGYGAYIPHGGMHEITKGLYRLATDIGVQFNFNAKVDEILLDGGKAKGVRVGDKQHLASIVVSNMDVWHTYHKLLPAQLAKPKKTLAQERSLSALIFYWGIKRSFPQLDVHNVFFTEDYKAEFDTLFEHKNVIDDPTVYLNITSKAVPNDAPENAENWFVMINVPGNMGQDWDEIIERSRQNIIQKLSRLLGEDIAPLIEVEEILDPRRIESRTSSYQGSLYGTSSNNRYAAFWRHANKSSRVGGLYFCGGSVHPGGGIPLAILSGKIVSELVAE